MSNSVIGEAMEQKPVFHHKIELCESKYAELKSRALNYQLCFDDKLFKVGQVVRIIEFRWRKNHNTLDFTDHFFEREITHVLKKAHGLMRSYLVISFK